MQSSDIPSKSPLIFAAAAAGTEVRNIPQTSADPNAASFTLGFPPNTFVDESAGGSPPDGRDFNGIFRFLSAWSRWQQSSAPIVYDGTFQASIGGYPKGARVQSATTAFRVWISTAENNTTNPDAGGTGWISEESVTYQDFTAPGSGNVTVPAWATHAEVHVVGGGGGGSGGAAAKSGAGGGAGGYSTGVIAVTPGGTIAYVVGAGGSAGAPNSNGGNGGGSSLGSIAANGGAGASSGTSAGGGGGVASGGPRNFTGGYGNDGNASDSTTGSGCGASGPFGGSGRSGNPAGIAGQAPGAGGGGGYGSASATGGVGAPGAVLIRWLV